MTTSPNGKAAQREKLRIAVIQPQLAVGAVEANLRHCAALVREASVMHSPDVILLPEAMTSPNMFQRVLRRVPQPVDGTPYQMIAGLAKELHCMIGGGFLSIRGRHARHTYVLAEPDGTTHLHDKDEPSMWENNFYRRPRRRAGLHLVRRRRHSYGIRVGSLSHGQAPTEQRRCRPRRVMLVVGPNLAGGPRMAGTRSPVQHRDDQ